MVDTNPKEQKVINRQEEYLFWFGSFLNQIPPVAEPEKRLQFIKQTKIPYGKNTLHFAHPEKVSKTLEQGYIPTSSVYDVLREGSTSHQILDTWTWGGKSRLEKEADKAFDERYGKIL